MKLLNNLLRGAAAATVANMVVKAINDNGGLQGLMQKFQQTGLGEHFNSWLGTGQNQPISGRQVHEALGTDQIEQLAQQMGVPPKQLADHLAELLPHTVDRMTPEGNISPQVTVTPENVQQTLER
jgi:uncharacterized protein YidB (DUF937 family)